MSPPAQSRSPLGPDDVAEVERWAAWLFRLPRDVVDAVIDKDGKGITVTVRLTQRPNARVTVKLEGGRFAVSGCVFCQIIAGDAPATVLSAWPDAMAIRPLSPVTPGHTLVIPRQHVRDALEQPQVAALTMERAAAWARASFPEQSVNIITSAGVDATQTVFHLHLHVVPRRGDDGLLLPWGMLNTQDQTAPHECPGLQRERAISHQLAASVREGMHLHWPASVDVGVRHVYDDAARVVDRARSSLDGGVILPVSIAAVSLTIVVLAFVVAVREARRDAAAARARTERDNAARCRAQATEAAAHGDGDLEWHYRRQAARTDVIARSHEARATRPPWRITRDDQ